MQYQLIVETFQEQNTVKLRLLDDNGQFRAANEIRLSDHRPSLWEGLFDTRRHLQRYEGSTQWEGADTPETAEQILNRLGVFLGTEVMGAEIFAALSQSRQRRTLVVKLPPAADNVLAAAFARVPWEIARVRPDQPALTEQNLIVRAVTEDATEDPLVFEAAKKLSEPLRVLFVFAEAPGSRPLAMRLEREQFLALFHRKIFPKNNVQADVLCHGVTRSVLTEQIRRQGGYHIVHWSGHGHHNLLEIRGEDGKSDRISGGELVRLLEGAGGFIPQMVFLSACLSGTFVDIRDWESFQAAVAGKKTDAKEFHAPAIPDTLENQPGYTGTALELLRCGVPQVIAMRYEVGDDYARELAAQFYKRFLADPGKHPADGALALARSDLLRDRKLSPMFGAADHATPLMFGREGRILEPAPGRSPQSNRLRPIPQPLLSGGNRELDTPENFVGRSAELTELNTEWLYETGVPVALIQGLAGMGKTALAAEAVNLWHTRFDYVFAFQAKPAALMIEEFFRLLDAKLAMCSQLYREKCDAMPAMKVHLEPDPKSPDARYERMRYNLLEALRDDAVLLVLDNFERNLGTMPRDDGYACSDPQWDRLLSFLSEELQDTRSRVLITSRHRLTALKDDSVRWIQLGALPLNEAMLYIRSHPKLRDLMFADEAGKKLVLELLFASRCHPLIMNRLAGLAGDRGALKDAINALEEKGWSQLPDLFAPKSEKDRETERVYLEDAALGSVDFLIERLTRDGRSLLWIITQANEPVSKEVIEAVWGGKSPEDELSEQLRMLLQLAGDMPGLQEKLSELPPELRAMLESPSDEGAQMPPVEPLLSELTGSGLISIVGDEESSAYHFHELVRERAEAWMEAHESERLGRTREQIWVAYGEQYEAMFEQGYLVSRESAIEAGRRSFMYYVRSKAFDKMGNLTAKLVTGTNDPALLRGVIAELKTVADLVPPGRDRWMLRTNLADALNRSGCPDQSLIFYEQAYAEAEAAEHWSDAGVICGNWAIALRYFSDLEGAKATLLRSADAERKAGSPKINVISSELEAFRIDVFQGNAAAVLPDIEARLNEIREWRKKHQAGEAPADAPERVVLGRALVSGLDIAKDANLQLENWEACLSLLKESAQAKQDMGESRHEIYRTRFNQYFPLMKLGRLDEAQQVAEDNLASEREANDLYGQSKALSALANIWDERGDMEQAIAIERQALSICNRLADPADRAASHGNLSSYLAKAGKLDEMVRHECADIIYRFVCKRYDILSISLNNLRIRMRRAAQAGTRYDLPPVSALVARPEFEALKRFLDQRNVDLQQLQGEIDGLVEKARDSVSATRISD
jgi:tetratricopeptide (TPR) repeat protein